ncbi:cation transporter [Arsenicicoccus dermatophilus]|uniref:cation transporter n=1 Tax=Arsenicicoccus dermatophilus TaxID=1076331 RepID=UPI0039173ED3
MPTVPCPSPPSPAPPTASALRRVVLLVAGLNLAYVVVEAAVAVAIGSVSLLADSVDFLEDAGVNLLIALALGWSLRARSVAGKVMAAIICVPALAAGWEAVDKVRHPAAPDVPALVLTAGGALLVNAVCTVILARYRAHGGSLTAAAWLAARNDVIVNAAIVVMGAVTAWTRSGWPDLALGVLVIALNLTAAHEVWEVAEDERVAAKALAGEAVGD